MLKIGLAQINSCVGDLEGNAQKVIEGIRAAKKQKIDIVVFPELSLTGYPPEDLLLKPHFVARSRQLLEKITRECNGIAAVVGFVDKDKKGMFNACALIANGAIKDVYHKVSLPNYGVFDEKRYFHPGEELAFCTYKGYKFAVSICEDIWRERFVACLQGKQLDFVINISASPFYAGKLSLRKAQLSFAAQRANAFVFYCNLIGGQDELVFDGTSMVVSPGGEVIQCAKRFREDLLVCGFDKSKKYPPCELERSEEEEVFSALSLGLSDYVGKNGFKKTVVGVSGGIDSAVVLALAVNALGKANVAGLLMPSRFTSRATFNDAKKICENLGVGYEVIDIEKVFGAYLETLSPVFKKAKPDKTEENLQARIRGNLLMAYSNKFGHLVLNTGNKSEVSSGYCTLYGDMVGGFGVLKDVPKMLVYRLSHYINKVMGDPIPHAVIKRAPSAELKADQKDQDTLPPYKTLDGILKLYVEEDLSFDEIVKRGFEPKTVKLVISMVDSSEYKRRQAPIGIKISPRAFGKDRRMPITNKFSN